MLKDRIKSTQLLIQQVKEAQQVQDRHRRSEEFGQLVQEKVPTFVKEVRAIRMVEKNYPGQWHLSSVNETMQSLKELMLNIRHEPRGKFGNIVRSFEPLQREAKMQWPAIAKEQHQDNKKALEVFRRIHQETSKLDNILQEFTSIEKKWPLSEQDLIRYQNVLKEATQFITTLGASSQIQQFLEKMAAGKATLNDLNDEVLQWIRSQDLTSRVFMTFK
ncbi:hypothetical protein [Paenibacillus sp. 37]|uniref:hypothetical protein n=1 Tax=Paenibacillus sp. 37 TaxID=2607911 RepID=UPI00122E729D|nr:hypothetical protein [Paenibacillus sp. 37]